MVGRSFCQSYEGVLAYIGLRHFGTIYHKSYRFSNHFSYTSTIRFDALANYASFENA